MAEARLPEPNAWRLLRGNPVALTAMAILTVIALSAVFGPLMMSEGRGEVSANQLAPPSARHLFGTDFNGRDLFLRVLEGARISLLVGCCGAAISLVLGTGYGMIAGYAGGKVDEAMMRLVDIIYSVPRLIIVIVFINAFDSAVKGWLNEHSPAMIGYSRVIILVLMLGLIEWLAMARIVRGQVLAIKSLQFVAAARGLGQSHARILLRHVLPNLIGIVIVYLTLTIPAVIIDESFLSFLGLGIEAPQASWGTLLSDGAQVINPVRSYWWLLVFPAIAMAATLLALNFLGDALRDALDPRQRR